ncbi:MAG: TerC family protein [Verrucomicrobia bacterium]|nr:TerC family protein [Verrucomicrobiota bacterium]
MMLDFLNWQSLILLSVLIGLELVLGIDNIVVISLIVEPLAPLLRQRARQIGLVIALLLRIIFILGVFSLVRLTTPCIGSFSVRDLFLLSGGMFLIAKGFFELYDMLFAKQQQEVKHAVGKSALAAAIVQIIMLDLLFSIDSVITAVGLTSHLSIIVAAVTLSFLAVLCYVGPLGEFILKYPSLKILALTLIVMIGASLVLQGFHYHFSEEGIYIAIVFAVVVELLQMMYQKNHTSNK